MSETDAGATLTAKLQVLYETLTEDEQTIFRVVVALADSEVQGFADPIASAATLAATAAGGTIAGAAAKAATSDAMSPQIFQMLSNVVQTAQDTSRAIVQDLH